MRFIIAGRTEAGKMLLSTTIAPTIGAVVSIGSPGDKIPGGVFKKPHLRMEFDDVPEGVETFFGKLVTPPNERDIQRLINSAPSLLATEGKILCHCFAGISRSSAAAYILNAISKGHGREEEALTELRHEFPHIHPNGLMIKIAARLMEWPELLETYNRVFGRI